MNKSVTSVLLVVGALAGGAAFAAPSDAFAAPLDDVIARIEALEKENKTIRQENATLRESRSLPERNVSLKTSARGSKILSPSTGVRTNPDPFGAYAADVPMIYKAPLPDAPGQFRVWAEGGAIWTGGDPVQQNFTLTDFTFSIPALGGGGLGGGRIPGSFNLTPKVGWEAAIGFDYRFANSPWHVSGQFRYGEGGKTNGSALSSGLLDPTLLALLGGAGITAVGGSETFAANYKETRWIADLAVGRDMFGSGLSSLQFKGGVRVAEIIGRSKTSDNVNSFINFAAPADPFGLGFLITSASLTNSTLTDQRNSFLGAGPRLGLEGSVPLAGRWAFDYLGDAAVLFGTQKSLNTTTTTSVTSPVLLALLGGGGGNSVNSFTAQRFATVFNADIQVGVSYWMTPNIKVAASYRLDAFINVQNQDTPAVTNLTPDRYIHGPRLTMTGQF